MSLIQNGVQVFDVNYNGVSLSQINHNGVDVWYKVNPSPTALLREGSLIQVISTGSRSPADKLQNYIFVNSNKLIPGRHYGFILCTSGERNANRSLYYENNIVETIQSRGYNSGPNNTMHDLTIQKLLDSVNGIRSNPEVSYYGSFVYKPGFIEVPSVSQKSYGEIVVNYTFNVSDPGKGGAELFVYPIEYLADLCTLLNIDVRRVYNSGWSPSLKNYETSYNNLYVNEGTVTVSNTINSITAVEIDSGANPFNITKEIDNGNGTKTINYEWTSLYLP